MAPSADCLPNVGEFSLGRLLIQTNLDWSAGEFNFVIGLKTDTLALYVGGNLGQGCYKKAIVIE